MKLTEVTKQRLFDFRQIKEWLNQHGKEVTLTKLKERIDELSYILEE